MAKAKTVEENYNLPTYTIEQAAQFLKSVLAMPADGAPSVVLVGNVGIGKTRIGEAVPRSLGYSVSTRHLAQVHPLDLGCVGIDAATREMYFAKPALVQEIDLLPEPRVLFLDEIDRIQPIAQSAMLQLLLDKKLNGHALKNTHIIGAGNGWYAQYTFELDRAFASRPIMLHVVSNSDEWLRWAAENRVHSTSIMAIAMSPDILNQHTELAQGAIKVADPRAWETLSRALHGGVSPAHAAAFVGEHAARTFSRYVSFAQDYSKEIATVVKGKPLDVSAKVDAAERDALLFGVYLAGAGQVVKEKVEPFIINAADQLGHEKAYIVGRIVSYRIKPEDFLVGNEKLIALRQKLFGAYKGDE